MRAGLPINQNGMSIVMVLVVTGIVGISTMAILAMGSQKRKVTQQMNLSTSVSAVKEKLTGLVVSPQSWQTIQSRNASAFTGPIDPEHLPSLDIYLPSSGAGAGTTAYYSSSNPTAGFDMKGKPCTGFNPDIGNDACPIHYDVSLKSRVFQNSNWIDTVKFSLKYRPATAGLQVNVNAADYSFDLVRNLDPQSAESACIAIGGNYITSENSCSKRLTKDYPACRGVNTFRGLASGPGGGNCEAKAIVATSCPGSQVIKGFRESRPICGEPL